MDKFDEDLDTKKEVIQVLLAVAAIAALFLLWKLIA